MAKQIIILDRVDEPSDNSYNVAYWLTIPPARVAAYADPNATSRFTQATAAELLAIQNGEIVEYVEKTSFVAGTGIPAIQAALINRFNVLQAAATSRNPWVRYGTTWDGAAWVAGGTA